MKRYFPLILSAALMMACTPENAGSVGQDPTDTHTADASTFDFAMHQNVHLTVQGWSHEPMLDVVQIYRTGGTQPILVLNGNTEITENDLRFRKADRTIEAHYLYHDGTAVFEELPVLQGAVNIVAKDARLRATRISQNPALSSSKTSSAPVCMSCPNNNLNAGAEDPIIATSSYVITAASNVPGWYTTEPSNSIEIWSSGFNGVVAQEGNQFFEINSNNYGTMYKELCLVPGSTMQYSIWHRGRSGVDEAAILIGGSIATAQPVDTMITGLNWTNYTGTYYVPAGETTTVFAFQALSTATGNISVGNFIDNFELTCVSNDDDLDGVSNNLDKFPTDSLRSGCAFSDTTTLAVEDLWPHKGDFDFNDIIAPYSYKAITNAQNNLVDLVIYYQIRARGGTKKTALGFSMVMDPTSVIAMSGQHLNEGTFTTATNGTESGTGALETHIIVEDLVENTLAAWNTFPAVPAVATSPDSVSIALNGTSSATALSTFTPYIVIDKERGRELRGADDLPSTLASSDYFGLFDDASDPASGMYYKTSNGLPWVLKIPGDFNYPIEQTSIENTYLNFVNWYSSGGLIYENWYDSNVPANIHAPNLY